MAVMDRVGALSGAAYMVLANVSMVVGADPELPDVPTGQESLDAMDRMAASPAAQAVISIELLAIVAWMVFVGYVCWRVRAAGWLAVAALVAGVVEIAVKLSSFPLLLAAYGLRDEISPEMAHVLDQMNLGHFMVSVMPAGLFVFCAAIAALRTRQLGRVLAWSGIVIGAANIVVPVVTGLNMTQTGFSPSFLLLLLWEVVISLRWGLARSRPKDSGSHQPGNTVTT